MTRPHILLVIGAALAIITAASPPLSAGDPAIKPAMLWPSDDPHPDLERVADAKGWTLDQASAQLHAADVVGKIASRIAAERPEIFVGSALSKTPGGPPLLYVKGPADAFVRNLIAGGDIDILLADRQPYSFDELEARKLMVHRSLEAAGFRNVVTGVNIGGGGIIPAAVAIEPGLSTESGEILASVPEDLRASVQLTVSERSSFRDTTSFGGMWVTKDGANYATSGWTVAKWNGGTVTYGVTTAGHAAGANGIVHPGDGTHTFVFQAEHRGQWGDIEWHTTNVAEIPYFYYTSGNTRPVLSWESRAGISVGESVCQYGRASNAQDCSVDVFDVSIACTLSGVWNDRLVQMNGITSIPGDSGGPWFYDYNAYGSQKGWCNNKDAWSVADLYDEALGVVFVTY